MDMFLFVSFHHTPNNNHFLYVVVIVAAVVVVVSVVIVEIIYLRANRAGGARMRLASLDRPRTTR
jgi:hypothetical protein